MFEAKIHTDRPSVALVVQQISVCIASVIWAFITVPLPYWASQFGPLLRIFEAASIVGIAFGPAFLFGRWIRARRPCFALSGRWIWTPPCVLLGALLLNALDYSKLAHGFSELLYPPHDGEQWWAVWLFTFPLLGCTGYALGASIEKKSLFGGSPG
jgi:hypothetical protein